MSVLAYLALGSNLGDRRAFLERGLAALRETSGIRLLQVSPFYETRPVGGPPGAGDYLNGAAAIATDLAAEDLLRTLLQIEAGLGRVRQHRDEPRTLDLDLLLYGDLVADSPLLTVPHPRLHERLFVLMPLADIAAGVRHPVLGATLGELRDRLLGLRLAGPSPGRELAGLRALVTGSTSGIGRAIALELAAAGAEVLIHGRRSREAAEAVVRQVRNLGHPSQAFFADLRDPAACGRLVEEAWQIGPGLDIWINNAGADTLTGEAAKWPFERKLQELLAVDLVATMQMSRDVGARMQARGSGVILTMGWDQADTGMEGDSGQLFAATKGGIMAFTKSLALSLAPTVRVHCLAPGWIRTTWGENAASLWQERVQRETPLRRWGLPEDVARVARWLVSPGAGYLTGQVWNINGGAVR